MGWVFPLLLCGMGCGDGDGIVLVRIGDAAGKAEFLGFNLHIIVLSFMSYGTLYLQAWLYRRKGHS